MSQTPVSKLALETPKNWKMQQESSKEVKKQKNVSLHDNISNMPFDQRSPQPPEVSVLTCYTKTDKQTYGNPDSMAESA